MHPELEGWLPRRLEQADGKILCRWFYAGTARFTAPFFEETVLRCLSLPENAAGAPVLTDLDVLRARAAEVSAIEPSVFLFHVSRCGSTLVSQLWSEDPAFLSLSEVDLIDQILRARFHKDLAAEVTPDVLLPVVLRLLAQRRDGSERCLLVKLDSWHLAFHGELRVLFPRTPFILLYRHPSHVLRSLARTPGRHSVPGVIEPKLFGWHQDEVQALLPSEYAPRVLQFYYEKILKIARTDPRSLLVSYDEGMMKVIDDIGRFAGINFTASHQARMRARASFQAKHPEMRFLPDPSEFPARDDCPAACHAAYEALEHHRLGGAGKISS